MQKQPTSTTRTPHVVLVNRTRFAKICAVEGLVLSERMQKAFEKFDAAGWSPERRKAYIRAQFQKKSA